MFKSMPCCLFVFSPLCHIVRGSECIDNDLSTDMLMDMIHHDP